MFIRALITCIVGFFLIVPCGSAQIQVGPPPGPLQYDISGGWVPVVHEDANNRQNGGEYEELAGLPVNEAARMRYESFSEDQVSLLEFQCRRYTSPYSTRTAHATIWITTELAPDSQQIVAFRINYRSGGAAGGLGGTRIIYMDGRPHPSPMAPHSFGGFSTGTWDGNMLNTEITHLKAYYTQRPGLPASDERTVSEHWVRHGNLLMMTMVIHDPVFFTEPLVWSVTWARTDGPQLPNEEPVCHASPEIPSEDARRVPFFLPGTNPAIPEVLTKYGLPEEVLHGGAEMMYPEYRKKMKQTASSLDYCKRRCTN
jgi:hypothetical protein